MAIDSEPAIARSDRFTRTVSYQPSAVRASDLAYSILVVLCPAPQPACLPSISTGHCGLHDACRWLGSLPMIPRFAAYGVSLLVVVFLIPACASRDEAVVEESTAAPSAPMHNRPIYTPGTEGTSAGHF
jgi:hypothetical protein